MTESIKLIIEAIIPVICVIILRMIMPLIDTAVAKDKLDQALTWTKTFVEAAEQLIRGEGLGEEKLEFVTLQLSKKLVEIGLDLTPDEIRAMIETAVKLMNDEKKPLNVED